MNSSLFFSRAETKLPDFEKAVQRKLAQEVQQRQKGEGVFDGIHLIGGDLDAFPFSPPYARCLSARP